MKKISLLAGVIVATAISGVAHAGTVNDTSLTAPGVYFGSGNSGTNFGWTVNTEGSVELGLTTIHRSVGGLNPTTGDTYNVPTGNNAPSSTTRAWWNFDFSINLRAGGSGTLTLGDVTARLSIVDVANQTSIVLNPFTAFDDNSAFDGTNTRNGNIGGQQATSADVGYQNSENLTFGQFAALGFNMNLDDTFLLTLSLLGPGQTDLGSVSERIVVGAGAPTPIPAALPLFASGLGLIGFVARRRKSKTLAAT